MKQFLYAVMASLLLLYACNNTDKPIDMSVNKMEDDTVGVTDNILKRGSTSIDVLDNDLDYSFLVTIDNKKQWFDLRKMGIPMKRPAELVWSNDEYACVVVWWSMAQSRHIFLPLKKGNPFIYLNKDIEIMDSVTSNIVYVDSLINDSQVVFAAKNLLTRKISKVTIPIQETSFYPHYDSITIDKEKAKIITAKENFIIDLKNLD